MDMIGKEVSSCLEEGKVFPPGLRFYPSDEELLLYYLKRKMCRRLRLDVIGETDVCSWEPEQLPGISKLRTGDRQWFFFSHRDRKYPNGRRSNRSTKRGYWKATGKDRIITNNSRNVGVKKTLVFYQGRAPKGERTDWVMHEYTMTEEEIKSCQSVKDNYALYKVFKKSGPGPKNGEQYGAPFKEEDWLDGLDASDLAGNVNDVTHVEAAITAVNNQLQPHGDGYEEFMNTIACEPISVQPLAVMDSGVSFAELLGEGESQNVFVGEALPSMQQHNAEASFDITQSATCHLPLNGSPNVTSAAKSNIVEGDIEFFLGLDDLIGPEFTCEHTERPTQVLEDVHFCGLGEFDFYQDLPTLLSEGEAGGQGSLISQQITNSLGNGVADPVSDFGYNNSVGGTGNLPQAYLWNGNDLNIVQRSYDQMCNAHTPGQARQGTTPIATPDGWYGMTMSSSMLENSGTQVLFMTVTPENIKLEPAKTIARNRAMVQTLGSLLRSGPLWSLYPPLLLQLLNALL